MTLTTNHGKARRGAKLSLSAFLLMKLPHASDYLREGKCGVFAEFSFSVPPCPEGLVIGFEE